jgi:hypothetical protein
MLHGRDQERAAIDAVLDGAKLSRNDLGDVGLTSAVATST